MDTESVNPESEEHLRAKRLFRAMNKARRERDELVELVAMLRTELVNVTGDTSWYERQVSDSFLSES